MTQEIELKFYVLPSVVTHLPQWLTQFSILKNETLNLLNTYYDTDNNALQRHKMGLRVRTYNQQHEMTLKTQGNALAGLHERNEYTVDVINDVPDLQCLSDSVFLPLKPSILQHQIKPIFTTHFERQIWLISDQQCEIEVALDRGEIKTADKQIPIQEIELELKNGTTEQLLTFAEKFSEIGGLRLSHVSKAAHGYQLNAPLPIPSSVPVILTVQPKISVEQGFIFSLQYALSFWQQQEEQALTYKNKALILQALLLVHQVFNIWNSVIARKASHHVREQLQQVEQLIDSEEYIEQAIYSSLYLQAKLALMTWLQQRQWHHSVDEKSTKKLEGSFKRFADIMLARVGAELKSLFSKRLTDNQYQDKAHNLRINIDKIYLLSGYYQTEATHYLIAWQKLLTAISDKLSSNILDKLRLQALESPAYWFKNLNNKN